MTERVKKQIPVSWGQGYLIFHLHSWGASRELEETHAWFCLAHQWHCVTVLFWSKGVHVDVLALDLQDFLTVQYRCFLPAVTDSAQSLPTPSRVGPTALLSAYYEVVIQCPRDSSESPLVCRALRVLPPMEKRAPQRSDRIRCEVVLWSVCLCMCVIQLSGFVVIF